MMRKVFVTHQLPGGRIHELAQLCDMNVWMGPGLLPASRLRSELAGCHGLVCLLTDRIDKTLLDAMPALQFVSSMSVGVDHVDVQALSERGIPLGNTPGVLVDTTADTAFALLLAAARRVAEADRFVRRGDWTEANAWAPEFFTGKDVSGATLGIVGLGEIGQAVARRAAGFGMRVVAWNRAPREVPGVEMLTLDELLACSDFVSIHVALAQETRNLLDASKIGLMKPGAVLVNTARGGIVDENALAAALAAAHHGITGRLEPTAAASGNVGEAVDPRVPVTLWSALEAMEVGRVLPGYFGERYIAAYAHAKRAEFDAFMADILPREYEWYL